ncbi:MAG: ABC transporter substrate-binding protein [Angustibacter sp.]
MMKARRGLRVGAVAVAGALVLAACGGDDGGDSGGSGSGDAQKGGTLTIITSADSIQHLDPQRNYTGEDLAFASAYLNRTLTAYKLSRDPKQANELVGDLATDIGKTPDQGKTWTFALRAGVKWEDGSDVTCEDIKYGVSRTFATDVITDGPSYAMSLLDIPSEKDKDGNDVPTYKGPYTTGGNDQASYDKAVVCSPDGKTITFNLKSPIADFNYTTTLTAFAPVPKAKDTDPEKYDTQVVSNGPYKIVEYTKKQQLVLERNTNWSPESDPYRPAYPDKIVMKFSVAPTTHDQRIIADAGEDQAAVGRDALQTASLTKVFDDPRYEKRRIDELSPYVRYLAIDVKKVSELKHRQALLVAADRAAYRTLLGGSFAGDLADGMIKPNLTPDYAPTGLWENLLGAKVPDSGDPELAKKLIAESGKPMPKLTYQFQQTPDNEKGAAALQSSWKKAGIDVKIEGLPRDQYYSIVQDSTKSKEIMWSGWGPDWSNASTVVPELVGAKGGFNLSQVTDQEFTAKAEANRGEADRAKQAQVWQELNKQAVQQGWILPTLFDKEQRLAGSKVGSASGEGGQTYLWSPFGSWSYADLFVKK